MKIPVEEELTKQGFAQAAAITRQYAKTFYFASHFFPKDKRYAAYSVYAVCRISDESVDSALDQRHAQNLAVINEQISAVYENRQLKNNLLLAFKQTVNKYRIPKNYFDDLLAGMRMDLEKNRYRDFSELETYCYRVAGVVGLIMLKITVSDNREAERYARDLGTAMQLTNIIRDIRQDYLMGRIYLPQDEMSRYAVTEEQIGREKLDENLINLLKFQIQRARQYYASSLEGIAMINDSSCRRAVSMMREIYAAILQSVEGNGYDVFSHRACVGSFDKLRIALKVLFKK
ncbi:phytoene/squalene synthase family protein [Candidatus Omnitrophota bacterium]